MNNSINYAGFIEMFIDSNEEFEPYGCSGVNENLDNIYNKVQAHKAGFKDRDYEFDN